MFLSIFSLLILLFQTYLATSQQERDQWPDNQIRISVTHMTVSETILPHFYLDHQYDYIQLLTVDSARLICQLFASNLCCQKSLYLPSPASSC